MNESLNLLFDAISHFPNGIRLQCTTNCDLEGILVALVQGIEIGSRHISGRFAPGDLVELPVLYFPHVPLPCEVRFAIEDTEVASSLIVASSEEVMAIIGHGDIQIGNFLLDNGLLRGSIINRSNGIHSPNAYIRINKLVVRSVVVEPPRLRDTGGAVSLFAVPIRIGDFSSSGLHIDLHISGIEYPLASLTYTHESLLPANERLLHLEESIRQQHKTNSVHLEMLTNMLEKRLKVQQERIDGFIEYALGILMNDSTDELTKDKFAGFVTALRASGNLLVNDSTSVTSPQTLSGSFAIPLDSVGFAFGWYDNEFNEFGHFRWMSQTGLIRNPFPARALERVEIAVSQVYGAHEPMVSGSLDDKPLAVQVSQVGKAFLVSLIVPATAPEPVGQSLHIESFASGSPAVDSGTNDQRILSIAVTRVEFIYRK